MNLELVGALNELEKERGISKAILMEAIEAAIVSAYKRNHGSAQNVRVEVDDRTGRIQVFAQKQVVESVQDDATEISLEEARRIDPSYQVGDVVEIEVTPRDFGRIAAQTAKQVVIQRIREAERSLIYEEFANKEGDIVTGIVQRTDHRTVYVDLGKIEAALPPSEQVPGENYTHGSRIKVYITEVRRTTKGPQVLISRTHPGLLKRLFELEVPEIHDGIVEIKAVAREPGQRSKVAVSSNDPHVDPVGACVGPRGVRVQAVVNELRGEKIDIVAWDPDPRRFIANALSPSKVVAVYTDPANMSARAVVPDHQLSLAIGKEGQNARLAARLTGWKIDIKSESQHAELAVLEAQRAFDQAEAALRAREEARARAEEEARRAAQALEAQVQEDTQEDEAEPVPVEAELAEVEADQQEWAAPEEEAWEPQADEWSDQDYWSEQEEAALETGETGAQPEELLLDESAQDWTETDLETWGQDDDLSDELLQGMDDEPVIEPVEELPAPTKTRKSRAAKKAELKAVLEEEILDDDDELLPSLFGADLDEEWQREAKSAFLSRSPGPSRPKGGKDNKKKGKKRKDKTVLKDFAELSDHLDDDEF